MAIDSYRTEVTPEYRHSEVMSTSRWLSNDKRKIYPVDVGRHSVRVKYVFEKLHGQQKLVGLGYYCEKCDHSEYVEHDRLYTEDDETISRLRGYMYGSFFESGCI